MGALRTKKRFTVVSVLVILVGLALTSPPVAAQSEYEDLEGRFALNLPKGWKLDQEQYGVLYKFASKGVSFMITYNEGETDLDVLFADQVDNLTSAGYQPPPPESVVDMTLNGCPARWTEYESPMEGIKVKMFAFAGAVVSEEDDAGVGFMAFMTAAKEKEKGDEIRSVWESLRLHGRPSTGVQHVVAGAFTTTKKAAPAGPSTFDHELVTLDLPSGWVAEQPSGPMQVVKLKHDDYGTVTVMAASGGDLGESPGLINGLLRDVLLSTVPSMKPEKEAWTLGTAGRGDAELEQFAGSMVVRGTAVDQGAIIGATKDKRGGVGYLAFFPSKVTDEAVAEIQTIIQSSH